MVTVPTALTDRLAARPMPAFALVLTKLGTVVMAVWSSSTRQLAYNADLERLGRTICAFLNFGDATREPARASYLHIGQLHIATMSNEVSSVCLCGAQTVSKNLCTELRLRQALHNFMGVCGDCLRHEIAREEKHVAGYGVRDVCGIAQPFTFEEASRGTFSNFEPYLRRLMTTSPGAIEGLLAGVTRLPEVVQCLVVECEGKANDSASGKGSRLAAGGSDGPSVLLEATADFLPSLRLSMKEGLEHCGSPSASERDNRCPFVLWAALRALLSPEGGVLWSHVADLVQEAPRGTGHGPSLLSSLVLCGRDGGGSRVTFLCKHFLLADRSLACLVVRCAALQQQKSFGLRFPVRTLSHIPCATAGPYADVEAQMDRLVEGLVSFFPAGPHIPLQQAMSSLGIEGTVNASTGLFELKAVVPHFPSTAKRDATLRHCFTEAPDGTIGPSVADIQSGGSLDAALSNVLHDQAGKGGVREVIPPRPPQRRSHPNPRVVPSPRTAKAADALSGHPQVHPVLERHPSGGSGGSDPKPEETAPSATIPDMPAMLDVPPREAALVPLSLPEPELSAVRSWLAVPQEVAHSSVTSDGRYSPQVVSEGTEAAVAADFVAAVGPVESPFCNESHFVTFTRSEFEDILNLAAACRARSPRGRDPGSQCNSARSSPRGAVSRSGVTDVMVEESGTASSVAVAMASPLQSPTNGTLSPLVRTHAHSSPLFPSAPGATGSPTSPGGHAASGNPLMPQRPPAGRPSPNPPHIRVLGKWMATDNGT